MGQDILSLMYHDVLDHELTKSGFQNREAQEYKIEESMFDAQLSTISKNIEKNGIDKDKIFLTFDDGGDSFINVIAPALERYGFKGYFFITTKFINREGFISERGIIDLNKRGHFIGVHSHSHPDNISLLKKEDIRTEWEKSLGILKDILKKDILYASIPGGFYSKSSFSILNENGIKYIFTSEPISVIKEKDGVKIIGRYAVTNKTKIDDLVSLMQSLSLLRIKKIVIWKVLVVIKKILGRNYFSLRKLIKMGSN